MAYDVLNKILAAAAEMGRNPVSKHQIQPDLSMEMSRLTRGGIAESASRNQIFRRERGQGNIHFPCSADHVKIGNLTQLIYTLVIMMCDRTYMYVCMCM